MADESTTAEPSADTPIHHENIHGGSGSALANKVNNFLNSALITFIMSAFTIYALYSEDAKVVGFEPGCLEDCDDFGGTDPIFVALTFVAFILFSAELLLQCFSTPGYFIWPNVEEYKQQPGGMFDRNILLLLPGSFYFWLDLISTATLVLEIPIFQEMFGVGTADNEEDQSSSGDAASSLDSARASKASRAGARAGRVVKIIRMVRLIRLVKLFKYAEGRKKDGGKKDADGKIIPEESFEDDDLIDIPQSHVGMEMTERTTKKVIVGVLVMLIVIPNLQMDVSDMAPSFLLSVLSNQRIEASVHFLNHGSQNETLVNRWKETEEFLFKETTAFNVSYLNFDDGVVGHTNAKTSSRDTELRISDFSRINYRSKYYHTSFGPSVAEDSRESVIIAQFEKTAFNTKSSTYSILMTTCVILLLGGITMAFTADVNNLVLKPIETMVALVREISDNPLKKDFDSVDKRTVANMNDGMETTLILQTITKIAGLMRVGFGDAGAEIIAKNLSKSDSSGLSLLGNGVKILSVFGFCDIRNFTDTTECLQEEVMLFVNRIAHILHGIVVQCGGAANKNIGDAFLLTWKLDKDQMVKGGRQEFVGDQALLSLLKNTAEMARHEKFICNFSASALQTLYERMPGYKCKMGCGLHMGWAVEGAIGSDKKIDASYISPHVNWAEFLESSTKEYGVPVLMSEPFFKLLSPEITKWCRQVDNIKKSASDEVTGLYCYDINPDYDFVLNAVTGSAKAQLEINRRLAAERAATMNRKSIAKFSPSPTARKVKGRGKKGEVKEKPSDSWNKKKKIAGASTLSPKSSADDTIGETSENPTDSGADHGGDFKVTPAEGGAAPTDGLGDAPEIILEKFTTEIWTTDEDLVAMRGHITPEILTEWAAGIKHFIEGDWVAAKDRFGNVLLLTNDRDGPTKNLLGHMENDYGGVPPTDWKGYRDMS